MLKDVQTNFNRRRSSMVLVLVWTLLVQSCSIEKFCSGKNLKHSSSSLNVEFFSKKIPRNSLKPLWVFRKNFPTANIQNFSTTSLAVISQITILSLWSKIFLVPSLYIHKTFPKLNSRKHSHKVAKLTQLPFWLSLLFCLTMFKYYNLITEKKQRKKAFNWKSRIPVTT